MGLPRTPELTKQSNSPLYHHAVRACTYPWKGALPRCLYNCSPSALTIHNPLGARL